MREEHQQKAMGDSMAFSVAAAADAQYPVVLS
jgi:hypothetical protein